MQPIPNRQLKAKLILLGAPLYASFAKIGIPQIRGSKILSGITAPTDSEKEALSKLVDTPVCELFPEVLAEV